MDIETQTTDPRETPRQREERLTYERALIAKACAELDAGYGIDEEALEAWLDALDLDETTPMPRPTRRV